MYQKQQDICMEIVFLNFLVSLLNHNSRKFSCSNINTFSRGDAFDCSIPSSQLSKHWKSVNSVSYSEPEVVLDPFSVKSLPSESQLNLWKEEIGNNKGGQWQYMETSVGRLDINCTNNLLKLYFILQKASKQLRPRNKKSIGSPEHTANHKHYMFSTPTSFIDNKLPCIFLAVFGKFVLGRAF